MSALAEFIAIPTVRAICDAKGRRTVQFCGMASAELSKRVLLTGLHVRHLVAEFQASRAGRSPIPPEHLVPAISAGVAYLGGLSSAATSDLRRRDWTLDGDVIRDGQDVIAVVMSDAPPELADLVKEAPLACAAALEIVEFASS
jgi:hypothetical protein